MDRSTTIKKPQGVNSPVATDKSFKIPTISTNSGLNPYSGEWNNQLASHLAKRTLFGVNYETIKYFASQGMDKSVDELLMDRPLPEPPLNYDFEDDPEVAIGETWVEANYYNDIGGLGAYRARSIRGWTMGLALSQERSIREKITLFWHNHFPISNIADGRFLYRYSNTIRTRALGDFKELVKDITIDPSMLRFLNGNQNSKNAPNENYARELLELFTIGKGDLVGAGDYTNYTEDDVVAIAKVLTGWRDYGHNYFSEFNFGSYFTLDRHDTGNKQLSHRFNNAIIQNNGELEFRDLIDLIFMQDEVSRFICRKLYRWFVYYQIDEDVEANVIEPMAQILRDNDYNIKPALSALLKSEHFYDEVLIGCMIKNPMDFALTLFNQFDIEINEELRPKYRLWLGIFNFIGLMQMEYFNVPSVAGWKPFYQEPGFYQIWINGVTLPLRTQLSDLLVFAGANVDDFILIADPFKLLSSFDDATEVNNMLMELSTIIYSQQLTENQIAVMKEILIPGLPDFEWTVEYGEYLADPENEEVRKSVEAKLKSLLLSMCRMPEYHLI
jgi:hypothetical protein